MDSLQNEINHKFTSHSLMEIAYRSCPILLHSETKASDEEIIEFLTDDLVFPFAAGAELGIHVLMVKTYPTHLKLPFNMQTLLLSQMSGKG